MEKPKAVNTYDPDSLLPENRDALLEGERLSTLPTATTSADDVLSLVRQRLLETDYFDESKVHVRVAGRRVTLTGEVREEFLKRAADDVMANCDGVESWDNQLVVNGAL
ncbi:BON domain-containing protein [Chitinasiproducens palmae]|uniref:BON domain-containing protein n=1 Tax=Chitinasiproducens palmae TaxID=1770053 RepID=A0A1H2PNF4_9BURK|nr:BON domain-containing protein [Chitinasiproducens palmae]SDV47710.1 BON domain-containing protein [Chitinasiproducens palmae]